mmetsp:Transcript_866/g.5423  ORF Transcript_866/g.5423 Transcript_866/m.5423 type:complete len:291 (-) Transcript_866:1965-2837(-)
MAVFYKQRAMHVTFGFGIGFSKDAFDKCPHVHGILESFPFHFHEDVPRELPLFGGFQLHHVFLVEGALKPSLHGRAEQFQQSIHSFVPVHLLVDGDFLRLVPRRIFQVQVQMTRTVLSDDLVVMPAIVATRRVVRPKCVQRCSQERSTSTHVALPREHAHGKVRGVCTCEGFLLPRKHRQFARRRCTARTCSQRVQPCAHEGVGAFLSRLQASLGRVRRVEAVCIDAREALADVRCTHVRVAMRFASHGTRRWRRTVPLGGRSSSHHLLATSLSFLHASNCLPQAARVLS